MREKAKEIASWLQLAYEVLTTPHLRRSYARRAAVKGNVEMLRARAEVDRALMSAAADLERREVIRALSTLQAGMRQHANDPSLKGYLGWALFQSDPAGHADEAKDLLYEAVEGDPSNPELRYFQGKIFAYLGKWEFAERFFRAALRLDPSMKKAEAARDRAQVKVAEEKKR